MPLLPSRVIVASDSNQDYIQFWPLVSKHWEEVHHLQVTLFFIGSKETPLPGHVIFVEPLPNIPTSFQAQMIRLFAPTLFPNECCVICDIDLLLLDADFFCKYGLAEIPETAFVSLNRYNNPTFRHVSLSYQVAYGKTFQEVFHCDGTLTDIRAAIDHFAGGNLDWSTDEHLLTTALQKWGQDWRKIYTPGLWGGKLAKFTVTRFANCQWNPQTTNNLQELEPFRPLLQHQDLVKKILKIRNPEFQFPDLTTSYRGTPLIGPSRHPLSHKNLSRARKPALKINFA